ncbi:hypothetical protein [Zobellella sp. DQSA1]|uniref:hypothetical protein n=1 Tax=Zobellella sp. DQSA1 TaxID=3342386 RepID=UPI0035C1C22F
MFAAQRHRILKNIARADGMLARLKFHYSHHDPRGRWFYRSGNEAARIQELPTGRVRIDFGVSA